MYKITCTSEHLHEGFILSCIRPLRHSGSHESFEEVRWANQARHRNSEKASV